MQLLLYMVLEPVLLKAAAPPTLGDVSEQLKYWHGPESDKKLQILPSPVFTTIPHSTFTLDRGHQHLSTD